MKTNNHLLKRVKTLTFGLACLTVVQTSRAEIWQVPIDNLWDLSQVGTFYADWDVFGAISDSTPELSFGLGSASVTETTGTAFVTGGGNIYSFSTATEFTTTLSGAEAPIDGTRTVIARFKTLGTILADDSVLLTVGGVEYAPTSFDLLYDVALGGMGGNDQEKVFVWESVPDGAYTFNFEASGSSMSLGRYATYASEVTPIPEPSTCVLFGVSSALVLYMVRRRRHAGDMAAANV
jgi:hypothetical protein